MAAMLEQIQTIQTDFSDDYTHVCLAPVKTTIYIEYPHLDRFYDIYCDHAYRNEGVIAMGEKIQQASPILVDIDLKRALQNNGSQEYRFDRLYSRRDVEFVVGVYNQVLESLFGDRLDSSHYYCVLLEKTPYITQDETYLKHGFHLHYPYLFLTMDDHKYHIFPQVADQINAYFIQMYDWIGTDHTVFDARGVQSIWLMYRSRKSAFHEPYEISTVYDKDLQELSIEDAFRRYPLFRNEGTELIDLTPERIYQMLPRILSVFPYGRRILEVPMDPLNSSYVLRICQGNADDEMVDIQNDMRNEMEFYENRERVQQLLAILSDQRASDYDQWLRIGFAIYNSCGPSKESLQLWIDFSRRDPVKFNLSACIHRWSKMRGGRLSIGTICMMASHDNPEAYGKLRYETTKRMIFGSLSGSHYDIALIIYQDYKDFFKCASFSARRWYAFRDHIWVRIEEGIDLRKKISGEIVQRYNEALKQYVENQRDAYGADETDLQKDPKVQQLQKIIVKLKTSNIKDNIMKECCELFYDSDFENRLDMNHYTIAFNNGVYDIHANELRPGRPDDYISKKMHINYTTFDNHHPKVLEVYTFLEKIFPDVSIREYFLRVCSSIFVGGNSAKKVFIWSGEGDNGKSVTVQIFEQMLGPYAIKLPTSLITGKRTQSSSACPELSRAGNGTRWAVLQEPDQRDDINVGILKELSGNDTYFARDLYQRGSDMREITPMFKLILVANQPPSITSADRATWERVRVIPFEATFVNEHELPLTHELQLREKKFAKDPHFYDKIPDLLESFAWLLLDIYRQTYTKQIVEPEKVKLATENYRIRNDILKQFCRENIQEDENGFITVVQLYSSFKAWFKEASTLSSNSLPQRMEFSEKIAKMWGDTSVGPGGIGWCGYKFIPLAEEGSDIII